MKPSQHQVDAMLHEAGDLVDAIAEKGATKEVGADDKGEAELGADDLTPVKAIVMKLALFSDVTDEMIEDAVSNVPMLAGREYAKVAEMLSADSKLKSIFFHELAKIADGAAAASEVNHV